MEELTDVETRLVPDEDLTPVGHSPVEPLGRVIRAPKRAEVFTPQWRLRRPAWTKRGLVLEEEMLEQVLAAAASRVTRTNVIAVVGPQGGPGKTRVAYMLAAALAWHSRLNVIAVDVDADYGALPDLVADEARCPRTLVDLLSDAPDPTREHPLAGPAAMPYAELRRYLSFTPSGMSILAGPSVPAEMRSLTLGDFDRLLELLAGADVVLLDCAGGITRERATWAIHRADQRVVVAYCAFTGATATANVLRDAEIPSERSWLVLNKVRGKTSELYPIRNVFARAGLTERFEIPYSDPLARSLERATYRLETLPRPVRIPIKELAARVAETLE